MKMAKVDKMINNRKHLTQIEADKVNEAPTWYSRIAT
jgi:hypothetical protein